MYEFALRMVCAVCFMVAVGVAWAQDGPPPGPPASLKGRTVVIVVAQKGFDHVGYAGARGFFEKAGADVKVASLKASKATGDDNKSIDVDIVLSKVVPGKVDGVVFIGGPGAGSLAASADAMKLVRSLNKLKKPIGAIEEAPQVLANAGILRKRMVYCAPSVARAVRARGGVVLDPKEMARETGGELDPDGYVSSHANIRTAVGAKAGELVADSIAFAIGEMAENRK